MFTVIFNTGGGTGGPGSQRVQSGSSVEMLPRPTRTGITGTYRFDGWFTAQTGGDLISDVRRTITSNTTFWARWTPIYDIVTFNFNQGPSGPTPTTQPVRRDTPIGPYNIPTRTGHTFTEWRTRAGVLIEANRPNITGSITVYAQWAINYYDITFNPNGGVGGPAPRNLRFRTTIGVPPRETNPTRPGHVFTGWFLTQTGGYQLSNNTIVTSDHTTWWAGWAPDALIVTFDVNGGSPALPVRHVLYDARIGPLPTNITRNGYELIGWSTQRNGSELIDEDRRITRNVTFFARWAPNNNQTATITFFPNGGIASQETMSVAVGALADPLPTATRDGHEFIGWFVMGSMANKELTTTTRIWGDKTVYAR